MCVIIVMCYKGMCELYDDKIIIIVNNNVDGVFLRIS